MATARPFVAVSLSLLIAASSPAFADQQQHAVSPTPDATIVVGDCDSLLADAMADIQQRGLDAADAILGRVQAACPRSAGPLRELAGVRFAQRRWTEAAALARDAMAIDANDTSAIDVLGSSLFMLDDPLGALQAWNRIGKPRLDT